MLEKWFYSDFQRQKLDIKDILFIIACFDMYIEFFQGKSKQEFKIDINDPQCLHFLHRK